MKVTIRVSVVVMAIAVAVAPALGAPVARKGPELSAVAGKARELRDKGIVKLNLSRYEDAVKLLEEAYELSRDPAILFDLVQAHRLNGNPERALVLCASFLRTASSLTPRSREQIRLQGKGAGAVPVPASPAVVKEKSPAGESMAVDAIEPPAATPLEAKKTKEPVTSVPAAAPLTGDAVKEAEAVRTAELLRADAPAEESASSRGTNWKGLYRSPWVWTAVGLVASGVAALVVYESTKDPGPPQTSWGAQRVF